MFVSWPFITRLLCNFIYQIFVKTFESPSVASDCRVFCNLHLTTNSQRYLNETTFCYWDKRTSLKMNSREQGYEDDRFENVVSQNFHCPICLNVFKDPVMCQRNQHYFQGWIQTVLWWVPSAEGTRFLGAFGGMRPKKFWILDSEMPFPGFWGQLWEYYDFAKDHTRNWQNNTFQVFKACMARTADPRFKRRTVVVSN